MLCLPTSGARSAVTSIGLPSFLWGLLVLLLLLIPQLVAAQPAADELDAILSDFDAADTDTLDEALGGFADEAEPAPAPGQAAEPRRLPDWLAVQGGVSLGASFNYAHDAPDPGRTDHRGLSRLKTTLNLINDLRFSSRWQGRVAGHGFYDLAYRIQGHDNYTDEVLDLYEHEAELDECYLQGAIWPQFDLKLGRQIVVWGRADNIRLTDVLTPLDNREPGLVDIRDLRLPVTMSKLDYYRGPWNLSGVVVHEIRFNKDPVYDSDFYPGSTVAVPEEKPGSSLDHQEFGLALTGIFSGWDISLYGAWFYNDAPHLATTPTGLERQHSRLKMTGLALNLAAGNWLLKGEAAYLAGLEFFNAPADEKSRLDLLLGFEYSGFSDMVIGLEAANRHLFDYQDALRLPPDEVKENEVQGALRVSQDFLHDTLTLSLLVSVFGSSLNDGGFQRFTCEYDWSDAINITIGLINYTAGEKLLWQEIGANDRIFMQLRYTFASQTE